MGLGVVTAPGVILAEEQASAVVSSLATTTLSGYVDTSAQWNMGTGNAHVPTYAFGGSAKADGFNLNVAKLTLEHPVDAKEGWAAGYKVDLIFGPDANTLSTQSSGVTGDFGVKQAYVALRAPVGNGLDFKAGVWDTIIGYEVFDGPNNPNATHSYGYTIEPTTHTGLLASYAFNDIVSASVGVADTFGSPINQRAFPARAESYKAYLGGLTLTAPSNWGFLAGSTLTGVIINGYNAATGTAGNGADQTSYYVGGTFNTPVEGLKVGASYDYLGVSEQTLSSASYANAAAVYASYRLTEKLTLHGRGEYATSDMNLLGASKVVAATGTLQYDLWKNVLSRLEFRWDHAADGSLAYGGVNPGDAPTRKNSYILMANVIYKF